MCPVDMHHEATTSEPALLGVFMPPIPNIEVSDVHMVESEEVARWTFCVYAVQSRLVCEWVEPQFHAGAKTEYALDQHRLLKWMNTELSREALVPYRCISIILSQNCFQYAIDVDVVSAICQKLVVDDDPSELNLRAYKGLLHTGVSTDANDI
jgi:hypothetical protein